MKPVRLAIVGATGIVGQTTLDVLAEWDVPLAGLRLLSSADSAGKQVRFRDQQYTVEELAAVPEDTDAAIFATSSELSLKWVPRFREAGVIVIDHSSCFRQDENVPLVIPEINGSDLRGHSGLVANPNCSASVMLLPLNALQEAFGLKKVIAATYQSVSGAGRAALEEMELQFQDMDAGSKVFPRRIAHNVIPEIGPFGDDGVTGEERKIGDEIRKILHQPDLFVAATAVRVPVHTGHCASMTIQLKKAATAAKIQAALERQPGMIYDTGRYHTPLEIAGRQEIFVSRLRLHRDNPDWLDLWVTGDNLRKGAASNAVQILQELFS